MSIGKSIVVGCGLIVSTVLGASTVFGASTVSGASTGILGSLRYSLPQINLYFLDFGYSNVAVARGIKGAQLNPAAVAGLDNAEGGVSYSSPKRWTSKSQFDLSFLSPAPVDSLLPIEFQLGEQGGITFAGGAVRLGKTALGLTFQPGMLSDAETEINTELAQEFSTAIPYTLTANEIPGLPPAESIGVVFNASGSGTMTVALSGSGHLNVKPVGLSFGFLRNSIGWGIGMKFGFWEGMVQFDGNATLEIDNMNFNLTTLDEDWDLGISVAGQFLKDSIWQEKLQARIQGVEPSLTIGVQGRGAPALWGAALEQSFGGRLSVAYDEMHITSETNFSALELVGTGITVDTFNHRLSGEMELLLTELPKSRKNDSFIGTVSLPPKSTLRLGAAAQTSQMTVHGGLGGSVLWGSTPDFGDISLNTGFEFKTAVTIRLGSMLQWQTYRIKDLRLILPPVLALGGGISYSYRPVRLDLGVAGTVSLLSLTPLIGVSFGIDVLF